jgi:hypothetical protein
VKIQPNVHEVSDQNLAMVTKGIRPPRVDVNVGGGSPNMKFLMAVNRFFADPAKYRAELVAALDSQEKFGFMTYGGASEQWVGTPHIELILNALSTLFLDAVRRRDSELIGYGRRFFEHLYAIALSVRMPNRWVIAPGPRMADFGPHSVEVDATVSVIEGSITRFSQAFRTLYRDTCAPWALLECLAKIPTLFEEAKTWTSDNSVKHWPVLRWPLIVDRYTDGHSARIEVPKEDEGMMGKIGSAGIGVIAVRAKYSTKDVAWMPFGVGQRWNGSTAIFEPESIGSLKNTLKAV